jgi:putative ABC transport system permease protein
MFNNYLKSAIRSLLNNKGNTVINITGMSIGFACCVVISLHVFQELSFDKFNKDADRIFRVCYQAKEKNGTLTSYLHPFELSKQLKSDVPQIDRSTTYNYSRKTTLKYNNQYFTENLAFAEPDFFKIFSFKILRGNPETFLVNPNDIIITADFAQKLKITVEENYSDLIGKTVEFPNNVKNEVFTIVGILDKVPQTSSMEFSMLLPFDHQNHFSQSNNDFGNTSLYIKLKKGTDISQVSKTTSTALLSFYESKIKKLQDNNVLANTTDCFIPLFQPLSRVYLDSTYDNDYTRQGNKTSLFILIIIGILILLVGCCNYILLSISQTLKKTNTIGIQKVLGARNADIFRYFFAEVNVLALIALIIGIVISVYLLPIFGRFTQTSISRNLYFHPGIILIFLLIYFSIININSIIPALFFSKGNPGSLLKKISNGGQPSKLPFVFVTLQYSLSIILIISSLCIYHQVKYMKYKDLGFTSKNVLCIDMGDNMPSKQRLVFRDQLKNHPGIINVTATNRNFDNGRSTNFMQKENGENVEVRFIRVDENYIPTLGLQLITGENFTDENINRDDRSIIVNQKFIATLGITNNPIGKEIKSPDLPFIVKISGVVKDFHFDSMKENLQPLALVTNTQFESVNFLFVRFQEKSISEVLPFINDSWDKIIPDRKSKISFWDKNLESRYQNEERWSQIINYASILSILIASLGLFGLTLVIISRRTKEIGIRKVNGAKVTEMLTMINKAFLKWVAIAFIAACPVAWYTMHKWLQNFAYKTELSWWIFALAGIMAFGIALLTVSWQSWRAATKNPVEALRYE